MLQSDAVSVSQDDIPQSNPEELWRALNMKAPGVYNVKTIVLVQWKLSDCDDGIKYGESHKNFLLLNISICFSWLCTYIDVQHIDYWNDLQ